jgi:hypothetical protein
VSLTGPCELWLEGTDYRLRLVDRLDAKQRLTVNRQVVYSTLPRTAKGLTGSTLITRQPLEPRLAWDCEVTLTAHDFQQFELLLDQRNRALKAGNAPVVWLSDSHDWLETGGSITRPVNRGASVTSSDTTKQYPALWPVHLEITEDYYALAGRGADGPQWRIKFKALEITGSLQNYIPQAVDIAVGGSSVKDYVIEGALKGPKIDFQAGFYSWSGSLRLQAQLGATGLDLDPATNASWRRGVAVAITCGGGLFRTLRIERAVYDIETLTLDLALVDLLGFYDHPRPPIDILGGGTVATNNTRSALVLQALELAGLDSSQISLGTDLLQDTIAASVTHYTGSLIELAGRLTGASGCLLYVDSTEVVRVRYVQDLPTVPWLLRGASECELFRQRPPLEIPADIIRSTGTVLVPDSCILPSSSTVEYSTRGQLGISPNYIQKHYWLDWYGIPNYPLNDTTDYKAVEVISKRTTVETTNTSDTITTTTTVEVPRKLLGTHFGQTEAYDYYRASHNHPNIGYAYGPESAGTPALYPTLYAIDGGMQPAGAHILEIPDSYQEELVVQSVETKVVTFDTKDRTIQIETDTQATFNTIGFFYNPNFVDRINWNSSEPPPQDTSLLPSIAAQETLYPASQVIEQWEYFDGSDPNQVDLVRSYQYTEFRTRRELGIVPDLYEDLGGGYTIADYQYVDYSNPFVSTQIRPYAVPLSYQSALVVKLVKQTTYYLNCNDIYQSITLTQAPNILLGIYPGGMQVVLLAQNNSYQAQTSIAVIQNDVAQAVTPYTPVTSDQLATASYNPGAWKYLNSAAGPSPSLLGEYYAAYNASSPFAVDLTKIRQPRNPTSFQETLASSTTINNQDTPTATRTRGTELRTYEQSLKGLAYLTIASNGAYDVELDLSTEYLATNSDHEAVAYREGWLTALRYRSWEFSLALPVPLAANFDEFGQVWIEGQALLVEDWTLILQPGKASIGGVGLGLGALSSPVASRALALPTYPDGNLQIVNIAPLALTVGAVLEPVTLAAIGGSGPYTFTASNLPTGLSSSGATISGTPTEAAIYVVTVTATDANSNSATAELVVTVEALRTVTPGFTIKTTTQLIPAVASFVPMAAAPGAALVITGSGFTGATAVSVGGVPVVSFAVVSDTKITTTVPMSAVTGKISVTNRYGVGYSSQIFTLT